MGHALPIAVAVGVMAAHTALASIIDAQHEVLAQLLTVLLLLLTCSGPYTLTGATSSSTAMGQTETQPGLLCLNRRTTQQLS